MIKLIYPLTKVVLVLAATAFIGVSARDFWLQTNGSIAQKEAKIESLQRTVDNKDTTIKDLYKQLSDINNGSMYLAKKPSANLPPAKVKKKVSKKSVCVKWKK